MRHALLIVSMVGLAAPAFGHIGDVGLAVQGGRIVTGIVEEPMPGVEVVVPGERVFGGDLSDVGGVIFGDEPGLYSSAATFPANSSLIFTIHGALRKWDGSSFDNLAAERLSIAFGPDSRLTPTTDTLVAGFGFNVGPTGGFDEHYDFTLLDAGLGNNPGTGVYLVSLSLASDASGLAESDQFWMVLNFGADELIHDQAIEFVEENIVPAPGAATLALGLGLLASRRRR